MVSRTEIEAAAERIGPYVRRTPCLTLGGPLPCNLKLEFLQRSGSFKARGAFNTLLSHDVPAAGVAAASGGNHGAAVAVAAAALGLPATIFVPEIVNLLKRATIEAAGATIRVGGARYAEAREACRRFCSETGALDVEAYDAPATIAGQGTTAKEWVEDAELDTVLVALGGGGLAAGFQAWFGDYVKVVAVEPEGSACYHAALEHGAPVDVPVESIAADSLGARRIGTLNFEILRGRAGSVLVPDSAIRDAQRALWDAARIVTEPGGAAAYAALHCGAYRAGAGERVGVLVCGANTDVALWSL